MKNQVTLFYDVETSGLIKDYHLPSEDPSHPHITQIAAMIRDEQGKIVARMNNFIRPDGWALDAGIQAFNARAGNGITQDRLVGEGIPIAEAMAKFYTLVRQCDLVCQWDKRFLGRMIRIEMKRLAMDSEADAFKGYQNLSLNKGVTEICAIPRARGSGFKAPSLPEAHMFFLGQAMPVTNNAYIDTEALVRIFDEASTDPRFAWPVEGEGEDA